MPLFQVGHDRYTPATDEGSYSAIDQRALARVVGSVAVGLPVILWIASHLPSDNPYIDTCFRYSISHFYYAPLWGTVFTGALCFIGAYLIVYRGEDRLGAENRLATYAGIGAFGIALFPTSGWGCDTEVFAARPKLTMRLVEGAPTLDRTFDPTTAFRLFEYASVIHYASAAVVFFFLAWFCFFVFTAVEDHQRDANGRLTKIKLIRNTIYYAAGTVIVLAILAMGSAALIPWLTGVPWLWWDVGNWTFWCEAAALIAFGVSWLVKGRFITWLEDET